MPLAIPSLLGGGARLAYDPTTVFGLGFSELLVILVIILIIFGAGKLPELGDGLGRGIKNFRKAVKPEEIDVTPRPDEDEEGESRQARPKQSGN